MFSLKTIIYAILSSEMLRENHAVLGGGGGIYCTVDFRPQYPFSNKI
jgi:predicted outer membrane repeat protein